MQFLYWLESIRNPVCDWFFSTITHLGDETAFLLIAIFLFWCVNKRSGYYLMISGFFGTIINQVMKLACKVPRPWVRDTSFTIVESAREGASGYSFPSGHSQNAVNTFGALFITSKSKWFRIVCAVLAVLVLLSRMYLGVHTPWDVVAGAASALVILILLEELFKNDKLYEKAMPIIVGILTAGSIAFFIYAMVSLPSDDENVLSAAKNARTMLGCSLGLIVVYLMDTYVVKFKTNASWYVQIIKFALGGGIVFVIKALFKIPLEAIMGDNERILRYFLIVVFAGAIWPMTFKFLSRIAVPCLDRLGVRVAAFFGRTVELPAEKNNSGEKKKPVFLRKTTVAPAQTEQSGYGLRLNVDYRKVKKAPVKKQTPPAEVDTGADEQQ